MKKSLLKEMYDSQETINKICLDDELNDFAKGVLIKEEQVKQVNLRSFFEDWSNA